MAVCAFFGCWIYSIAAFGWFLGLGLGWLPSYFIALIVYAVGPPLLILALFLAFILIAGSKLGFLG